MESSINTIQSESAKLQWPLRRDICALAAGAHRVATMGIRALVERLMIDQVQDKGSFEKNIKAFFDAGHVAPNQQAVFRDTLIEAGHAAMHRDFEPTANTWIPFWILWKALCTRFTM
jgi:hypothetical protein